MLAFPARLAGRDVPGGLHAVLEGQAGHEFVPFFSDALAFEVPLLLALHLHIKFVSHESKTSSCPCFSG